MVLFIKNSGIYKRERVILYFSVKLLHMAYPLLIIENTGCIYVSKIIIKEAFVMPWKEIANIAVSIIVLVIDQTSKKK